MREILIVLSMLCSIISSSTYINAILRGQAKPHRTSRIVWLVVTTIILASMVVSGTKTAIWQVIVLEIFSIVLFFLSIKFGMGGWAKGDIVALILATIGIVGWQISKDPLVALIFSIFADFSGMLPTTIKTWKRPDTEIVAFFLFDVFAGLFTLFAISDWTISEYLFPLYVCIVGCINTSILVYRKKQKSKSQKDNEILNE